MSYRKLAMLLDALYDKTNSGAIGWDESAHSNSYETSFPNYSVLLNNDKSQGRDVFILYIIDANGDVVEEASDADFSEFIGDPYSKMKDMYETARRQAKGVDQALDEILKELDDSGIPF